MPPGRSAVHLGPCRAAVAAGEMLNHRRVFRTQRGASLTVIQEARTVRKVADSFGWPLGSQGPVKTNEMFPSMSVLQNNRRGRRPAGSRSRLRSG